MQILIIEQSREIVNIMTDILKDADFDTTSIDTVNSEIKALDFINDNEYDLVLSAWASEDIDGKNLLQKIKEKDENKKTKFIAVSSDSTSQTVVGAIQAGVNNFIVKPFTAETLLGKIDDVMKR